MTQISELDRYLISYDIERNPFLSELISTSNLKDANSVKKLIELIGSANYEIQLATVVKSVTKSVLITIKNTASTWPKIAQYINIIKPENISTQLTFDEQRSIILHKRDRTTSSALGSVLQRPYFLIAKNLLFSMISADVNALFNFDKRGNQPVEKALEKVDKFFETSPASPILIEDFQSSKEPSFSPYAQPPPVDDNTPPPSPVSSLSQASPNNDEQPSTPLNLELIDFHTELEKIFPTNENGYPMDEE